MDAKFGKLYQALIENLHVACENIKSEGVTNDTSEKLPLEEFWSKLVDAANLLHHEVTKMGMAFSKPPYPNFQDTVDMLSSLEASCIYVLSVFYKLSQNEGLSLYKEVHTTVIQIMNNVIAMLKSMKFNGPKATKERLKLIACVWETCESVRYLPKNNVQVTVKVLHQEEMIILDASREIEGELKEQAEKLDDTNGSEVWSEDDKKVVFPCVGLLKSAFTSLKRARKVVHSKGTYDKIESNKQLDSLVEAGKRLSPAVDDFATSLYPPMNRTVVQSTGTALAEQIRSFLKVTKECNFITEEDNSWIDFLQKAVDHNLNKICLTVTS